MRIPLIKIVEWVDGKKVRLFLSSGEVYELSLPWVKDARNVRIVDGGMGLDPGDGYEVSVLTLLGQRGKRLVKGRRGWVDEERVSRRRKVR